MRGSIGVLHFFAWLEKKAVNMSAGIDWYSRGVNITGRKRSAVVQCAGRSTEGRAKEGC